MIKTDLCIIGAGSGGLTVASVAAQAGLDVTLIEKHKMGGDCLNYGCVPSKSIIASARTAHQMRTASKVGLDSHTPNGRLFKNKSSHRTGHWHDRPT